MQNCCGRDSKKCVGGISAAGREASVTVKFGSLFTKEHKKELLELGYTVIHNVLSSDDCAQLVRESHQWLSGLGTGIDVNDHTTWKWANWPFNSHGIIQHGDVGHSNFVWNVRSHPRVVQVFREIYGTSQLICSFDGVSIDPPQEKTAMMQRIAQGCKMHTDQRVDKSGFHCAQAFVSLFPIGDKDACLRVVPKSHLHHKALITQVNKGQKKSKNYGWHVFGSDRFQSIMESQGLGKEPVRVTMPAGSMVLWDGRLVHGKGAPRLPRDIPRWRTVIYVCMTPAAWATQSALRKRIKAFEQGRMTSHWPHTPMLFAIKPRTYGAEKLEKKWNQFHWRTSPPKLDEVGLGLVGYPYLVSISK